MRAPSSESPLRIGLLLLDSIDQPHRSVAGDYDALFAGLLAGEAAELVLYDGRSGDLPPTAGCDGWIVPGSRESVYADLDWISSLSEWVGDALDAGVPMVGICFGHQLIAQVLGARVERADAGWSVGAVDYTVHGELPSGALPPDAFRILASHQDQVLDLPAGTSLFASSPRCPIAGYSIDRHVLCIQAHPEWVPDQAASMYASRVERLGQESVDAALASLSRPLDRELVASWMVDTIHASKEAAR